MGLIFTEVSIHNSGHVPTCNPAFFLNNFLKSSILLNLKMESNFFIFIFFLVFQNALLIYLSYAISYASDLNAIIQTLQAFLWNKISK